MLFNPQLTNTGNLSDTIGLPKLIKSNKPNYLFSDIVRLVGTNQTESSSSNFNAISTNSSSNIFQDILDEAASVSDNNSKLLEKQKTADCTSEQTSVTTTVPDNSGSLNTVSAQNLQTFLSDLFNQLSSLGFVLNNVKGISPQTDNAVNLSGESEVEGKKTNEQSKPDQLNNVNLNQAIFSILQANKPVVLNFNFQGQPVQIEISNFPPKAINETAANNENPGAEKFISNLLDRISTGNLKYQVVSKDKNSDNNVLLAASLNGVKSNINKLKEVENPSPSKYEIPNYLSESSKEDVNSELVQSKDVGQVVNSVNSKIDQMKSDLNDQFTITVSSPNKNSTLKDIQDLEQYLYGLNNTVIKNNQQNAGDTTPDSGSLIKNFNPDKNIAKVEGTFPVHIPELFSEPSNPTVGAKTNNFTSDLSNQKIVRNFIIKDLKSSNTVKNENVAEVNSSKMMKDKIPSKNSVIDINSVQPLIKSRIVNPNDINLKSIPVKNLSSEILKEAGVQTKISGGDTSTATDGNDLKSKDVIREVKTINSVPTNDAAKVQSDPVNNLAGTAITSKQQSNNDNENKSGNNGNIITHASSTEKADQVISTNVDTSGKDNGNSSDAWKKQFSDATISSSQALNSNKQSVIKDNIVDQNVQQFNNVYKTIQASNLITEISHFIEKGKSKSLELKLKPDNLGKVKVSVEVIDKVVHTNIEVENESVKQIVQNNIDSLKQSLTQNGLQLSNVSVSVSGGEAKSNKSFVQKKKTNHTSFNKKIDSAPGAESSKKSMGYNTYEYLI